MAAIDVNVPTGAWMQQSNHIFAVATTSLSISATIDPDHEKPKGRRVHGVPLAFLFLISYSSVPAFRS